MARETGLLDAQNMPHGGEERPLMPMSGCVGSGRRPRGRRIDEDGQFSRVPTASCDPAVATQCVSGAVVREAACSDAEFDELKKALTEVRYRDRCPDAAVDASGRCNLTQPEVVTGELNRPNRSSVLCVSRKRRRTRQDCRVTVREGGSGGARRRF